MELILSVSQGSHSSQIGLTIADLVTVGPLYCILLLRGRGDEVLGVLGMEFGYVSLEGLVLVAGPLYHWWLGPGTGTTTETTLRCACHRAQNGLASFVQLCQVCSEP